MPFSAVQVQLRSYPCRSSRPHPLQCRTWYGLPRGKNEYRAVAPTRSTVHVQDARTTTIRFGTSAKSSIPPLLVGFVILQRDCPESDGSGGELRYRGCMSGIPGAAATAGRFPLALLLWRAAVTRTECDYVCT